MAFSGNIKHYLGHGTLALRPADPGIHPEALAFYLVTDNLPDPALTMWDGTTWVTLSTGGAAAAWGAITGTLSSQTDLQTALDAKLSSAASTGKAMVLYDGGVRELIAGTNISFDVATAGEFKIIAAGGGGGSGIVNRNTPKLQTLPGYTGTARDVGPFGADTIRGFMIPAGDYTDMHAAVMAVGTTNTVNIKFGVYEYNEQTGGLNALLKDLGTVPSAASKMHKSALPIGVLNTPAALVAFTGPAGTGNIYGFAATGITTELPVMPSFTPGSTGNNVMRMEASYPYPAGGVPASLPAVSFAASTPMLLAFMLCHKDMYP